MIILFFLCLVVMQVWVFVSFLSGYWWLMIILSLLVLQILMSFFSMLCSFLFDCRLVVVKIVFLLFVILVANICSSSGSFNIGQRYCLLFLSIGLQVLKEFLFIVLQIKLQVFVFFVKFLWVQLIILLVFRVCIRLRLWVL